MTNIYEHANDLHVRARYVYSKSSDSYAYEDAAFTKKVTNDELRDMFIKGVIVIIDPSGAMYKAVKYTVSSGTGTITYVKADTTTATTAVLATLDSASE